MTEAETTRSDPTFLSEEALRILNEGRPAEALPLVERAIDLYRRGPVDPVVEGTLLLRRTYVLMENGESARAVESARALREVAGKAGHRAPELTSYSLEGDAWTRAGDMERAMACFRAGLERAGEDGPGAERARLHGQVARTHVIEGRIPEGLEQFLRALEIRRRIGDPPGLLVELLNLSGACGQAGADREALAYAEEALSLAGAAGISRLEVDALKAVAAASLGTGAVERALACAERARSLTEGGAAPRVRSGALAQAGMALLANGRREDALRALDEAVALAEAGGLPADRLVGELGRAWARLASGDVPGALRSAEAAAGLLETVPAAALAIELEELLSVLHQSRGDTDRALRHARGAVRLREVRRRSESASREAALRVLHGTAQVDRQIRRAVERLPVALLLLRPGGAVEFANDMAARLFDRSMAELSAAGAGGLLEAPTGDPAPPWAAGAPGPADARDRRFVGRWAGGETFAADVSFTTLGTETGPLYLCCVRDVSRAVAAEKELRREKAVLLRENIVLREEVSSAHGFEEIIGRSDAIRRALVQVGQVAPTDASVLLLGETGTGKELVARAIHAESRRSSRTMVTLNCAALPETLIESELFGHEKGAFTGAQSRHPGRFELADGSTLFLDEIGDLPLALQSKLLRVLQDGRFQRLGGTETLAVDVRVIAATHRDLEAASREGSFRSDLYYRLAVFPIEVPPLRERTEDIPLLASWFAETSGRKFGRPVHHIPPETIEALKAYDWPGNVRELRNIIERATILSSDGVLRLDRPPGRAPAVAPAVRLEDVERQHIISVLDGCDWKVKGPGNAAEVLDLHPSTLRSRMEKLGIRRPER